MRRRSRRRSARRRRSRSRPTSSPPGTKPWSCGPRASSLFRGTVTQKTERTQGTPRRQVWDVEATDLSHWLGRVHPVGAWTAVSGTTVITALLASAPGFSAAGVEAGLAPVTLVLDGTADAWAAILDVCGRCGAKAFLDGSTLYVFTSRRRYAPAPAAITESNPDLLWPDGGGQAVTIDGTTPRSTTASPCAAARGSPRRSTTRPRSRRMGSARSSSMTTRSRRWRN